MRPRSIVTGSWRLGGPRYDWPTASSTGLTVGTSLTLRPRIDGPRSLRSQEGTLGGLVLPPTLAVAPGVVWLLDRQAGDLRRFEPLTGRFVSLSGWGVRSGGAQWFGRRAAVAATCGFLAIADPEREDLVVVADRAMAVRAVLHLGGRRPVSIAAQGGRFHVLDDRSDLWVTTPGMDRVVNTTDAACRRPPDGTWTRLIVDVCGRPMLADLAAGLLAVPDPPGGWQVVDSVDAVRSRTDPPALAVDQRGRFRVPAGFRLAGSDDAPWFDARGEPATIRPDDDAGPAPYVASGWWTSQPFDSGELGCRWYRLTLTGSLPLGCACSIETYTSDELVTPEEVPPEAWTPAQQVGDGSAGETSRGAPTSTDHAVLSPRGRHLVVRIGLRGDGWASPSVDGLLVEPEAAGLERHLPAVYRGDDSEFLRRFLAIFGSELDGVEHALRSLPARFSPRAVPDELLDTLATELGVPLERAWTATQRRRMLAEVPRWHRRRGTPAAIRALVRTHLEATSGRTLPPSLPGLVEGFRERPEALLGEVGLPMGTRGQTWSDSVMDRPVLGRRRVDRIGLVSGCDPEIDRFRVYAHRFKVVVARTLVPGQAERDSLERLIAAEKPAHVAHELVLVEPRAVIGQQGALGVDTYVGDWPVARLVPAGCDGGHALGLGLRLCREAGAASPPARVGDGGRVGVGTVLI